MSQANREAFQRVIEAYNRRDAEALLRELDTEIEWRPVLPVVLGGDFNVVPTDFDIYNSKSSWKDDALLQPAPRALYARLVAQGWCDALRKLHPEERVYTFWDYLRNAWQRDAGLRIDHILLSPTLEKRLKRGGVDKAERGAPHASDHAPAWVELRKR